MASPVVTIEATPTSVPASGGQVAVKISAYDPDVGSPAKVFAFAASAASSDGETVAVEGTVTRDGVPGDTIVGYALTCDEPGVGIVPDPVDPSRFTVTIPAVA